MCAPSEMIGHLSLSRDFFSAIHGNVARRDGSEELVKPPFPSPEREGRYGSGLVRYSLGFQKALESNELGSVGPFGRPRYG